MTGRKLQSQLSPFALRRLKSRIKSHCVTLLASFQKFNASQNIGLPSTVLGPLSLTQVVEFVLEHRVRSRSLHIGS